MKIAFLCLAFLAVSLALPACSSSAPVPPPSSLNPTPEAAYSPDLPLDVPTYFLPQQNPVGINPGNFLGTVYTSEKDRYYHRQDCSRLGRTVTALSLTEAKIKGYSACPLCKP
jgi:hypothetical protein